MTERWRLWRCGPFPDRPARYGRVIEEQGRVVAFMEKDFETGPDQGPVINGGTSMS